MDAPHPLHGRPRRGLEDLTFDNRFTRELPADPDVTNRPRRVDGACFSRVQPATASAPRLVAHSPEVAELLGPEDAGGRPEELAQVFSGNRLLPGMDPHAMCYGGHQFGQWAGQLGDGRAINLGEVVGRDGAHWTLQLKGAGPTPYSRSADGFAVLRSSVREFLCSEAMHHLGVPTTRAFTLVTTGDEVTRDMFYDGNPKEEPGAVVCRVARSFVRFGNFELCAARGDLELLRRLAGYALRHDFPHLLPRAGEPSSETYLEWFREVVRRTAELIVHWMRVGFVHGVMNTDNMSILGETIDYGPYGWIEDFDPGWTPNTTDAVGRRYRFGTQGEIAHWNLTRLASSLVPLVGEVKPLQEAVDAFPGIYLEGWRAALAAKLGLSAWDPAGDEPLTDELLEVLQLCETDMTLFFRALATVSAAENGAGADPLAPLMDAYYVPSQLTPAVRDRTATWLASYRARARRDGLPDEERRRRMDAVNPLFVPRNYLAQLAIDRAEAGDPSLVTELLDALRRPYDEQPGREELAAKRPDWARERPGCSMLSCSS